MGRQLSDEVRRFADVEAKAAETFRDGAAATRDPEASERRERLAAEAEHVGKQALDKADSLDEQCIAGDDSAGRERSN